MRITSTLLLTFAFFALRGQTQKSSTAITRNFSGKVDKYPVEMTITSYAGKDSVIGSYYYIKSGSNNAIHLKGTLNNNTLTLTEINYSVKNEKLISNITGHLNLEIAENWGLTGVWANAKADKKLAASLTCLENKQAYNPLKNRYEFIRYTIDKSTVTYPNWKIDKIKGLNIFNEKGILIQSLRGFDEYIYNGTAEAELEDLNFDGMLDLKIQTYLPEATKGDIAYLYFLYNPIQKKYIRSPELEELQVLSFDAKNKIIEKDYADGSGNESTHSYKWLDGKFYLIKKVISYENDDATYYEEYKIINKKSVKVKSYKSRS
ncbi:hypothetical protein DBR43_29975 [Pedobacter sp. KBW06]|uniref:XAC2610-related protein n=1 Tax=Pedobacter sp. KBW06 TaxID=2153359 RepID=UPI000F5A1FFE|nr:hypothetical protein [Pedobacter sp. KBW06]RQO66440.1 hypothetical protein DBR43_29975 [Pedobacter sp. KBW06]